MNHIPMNPRDGASPVLMILCACASPVGSLLLSGSEHGPQDPAHVWAVVVLVSVAMICQTWYQVSVTRRS
ncbi:hypothetical protein ADK86_28645 [Streptomyces sp. NRRL F-5755]|uniref:hypothetical protein n=1 Tax=Streptomyces sp. NRRL F-5755 TaxID=1519475 RepID=UPI0006AF8199|nr:hypothetical protein [Streptomyces sp. NRRL F-5755]KOT89714.1 hypothetical protein ADK86_28645 [Streptomyces sp. NRRL F-5755]